MREALPPLLHTLHCMTLKHKEHFYATVAWESVSMTEDFRDYSQTLLTDAVILQVFQSWPRTLSSTSLIIIICYL
jgi:hypothetical protein